MITVQPEKHLPKIAIAYDQATSRVTYEMGEPVGGLMILHGMTRIDAGRIAYAQANLGITKTGKNELRELVYGIVEPLFEESATQVITEYWALSPRSGWKKIKNVSAQEKEQLSAAWAKGEEIKLDSMAVKG